jgi:ADP-ribose pyrophosphatase
MDWKTPDGWELLAREVIVDQPPFLTVEQHTLALPDGQIIQDWQWLITPDYVNVLAETSNGRLLCLRQPKYGYEGLSLAPVGGYIDAGEAPLQAAKRELLEETGYEADVWIDLGQYRVDANRGAGMAHLYLARGARRVAAPDADDLEEQELVLLSPAELEAALVDGEVKVLGWATVIALALRRLRR